MVATPSVQFWTWAVVATEVVPCKIRSLIRDMVKDLEVWPWAKLSEVGTWTREGSLLVRPTVTAEPGGALMLTAPGAEKAASDTLAGRLTVSVAVSSS